jgi:hypothetical protein
MGERTRKPGEPGFGTPGKPGSVSDPDPGGSEHTLFYHRTLLRVPGQDPVTAYPSDAFAGDTNKFVCYTKSNQDFVNYCTAWEKRHSTLSPQKILKDGVVAPVVDKDLTVVGHFGWFTGTQIWLPESTPKAIGTGG